MITLMVLCQNEGRKDIEQAVKLSNDRKWCAENAIFTIDGISFFPAYDIEHKPFVFAVNNARLSNKLIYRMNDDIVIESSMSEYSFSKFQNAFRLNKEMLLEELNEVA